MLGGVLMEASLARALVPSVGRAAIGEMGVMTLRTGTVAEISAFGVRMPATTVSTRVAASTLGRVASGVSLTESSIAMIADSAGLPGVLQEMTMARVLPRINDMGQITFEGRPILSTQGGWVCLPSAGLPIGQLRGTRIFTVSSMEATGTEIGHLSIPTGRLAGEMSLKVTRVRSGWYQVELTTVIPGAEGGLFGLATLGGRVDQHKTTSIDSLLLMATVSGEQRRKRGILLPEENLREQSKKLQVRINGLSLGAK